MNRLQDADPSILEKFNKQKLEQQFNEETVEIKDDDIKAATANDGTLPTPEQFKKLSGNNPEVMTMLQSPKAMSLVMTGAALNLKRK